VKTQLALEFDANETGGPLADRIDGEDIHVSRSTFLNGLASRVHRWFRLPPSFGPELVHEIIDQLEVRKNDLILDPFAGAGTTLIEAKLEGRHAIGLEINPLLHFVCQTSVDWSLMPKKITAELERVEQDFGITKSIKFDSLEANGFVLPPIHNPTRWWRPDVLCHLLVLKRAIEKTPETKLKAFLKLGLAGVLVPDLTNVTLGRLQLHFSRTPLD
jgi:hypothetical protein